MRLRDQVKTQEQWPTPHGMSKDGRSNDPSGNELGRAVNQSLFLIFHVGNNANAATTSGATSTNATQENAHALQLMNGKMATRIPTPSANDWKGSSKPGQRRGQLTDPAMGVITPGGSLNPTWVEWLMGWPLGWTDCAASATDRFRQWLDSHGCN